jgi:integrase
MQLLVDEVGEGDKLLRMPPDEDRAELLRKHLEVAGCTREALTADDAARAPIKFHNLRDTCLTHMAKRGDDPLRIQWRAGHTAFAMTEKYIAEAKRLPASFGWSLPPLPASMLVRIVPVIVSGRGGIL